MAVTPAAPLRALRRPLALALWLAAGSVLAGWLALATLHVRDDYRVSHMQGVWIAAAESAREGRLYPPIVDGEYYAGTRYMPLPILLNAAASAAAGDPLVGGKILAAVLMAGLLALVVFVLRRRSCPWPIAAALAATIVATDTGLQAGTTIGGDLLPVVLQTGALAAAAIASGRSPILIAGVLAGLAMGSKLTALWAFLAIATWLAVRREWQRAGWFVAASVVSAVALLGTVQILTAGRLSEHLLTFSLAGVRGWSATLRGPNQILFNLLGHAWGAVVLVPLALLGPLVSHSWRGLSVFHIALIYALLLLMVVYADVGTGFNQLLDLTVLIALAVGNLAGDLARDSERSAPVVISVVMVSVLWAVGLDLVRTVGFDLRAAVAASVRGAAPTRAAVLVSRMVQPEDEVLAEDPSVYVALHRRPVVMDPFMVMRLAQLHPERVDSLLTRIAERRFDLVVLVYDSMTAASTTGGPTFTSGRGSPTRFAAPTRVTAPPAGIFCIVPANDEEAHGCDPRCPAVAPCHRRTGGSDLRCRGLSLSDRGIPATVRLERLAVPGSARRDHRSSSMPVISRPPGNASVSGTTRCTRTRATHGSGLLCTSVPGSSSGFSDSTSRTPPPSPGS